MSGIVLPTWAEVERLRAVDRKVKDLIALCDEAEAEAAGEDDADARVTLCGNRIYTSHVRHILRFLKEPK